MLQIEPARTCLVCPMRLILALACSSIIGFQSLSKMMTVSAVCRLTPCPPARVDSRKTKISLSGSLNSSISFARSSLRPTTSVSLGDRSYAFVLFCSCWRMLAAFSHLLVAPISLRYV